jgi:hypothetical protein
MTERELTALLTGQVVTVEFIGGSDMYLRLADGRLLYLDARPNPSDDSWDSACVLTGQWIESE